MIGNCSGNKCNFILNSSPLSISPSKGYWQVGRNNQLKLITPNKIFFTELEQYVWPFIFFHLQNKMVLYSTAHALLVVVSKVLKTNKRNTPDHVPGTSTVGRLTSDRTQCRRLTSDTSLPTALVP